MPRTVAEINRIVGTLTKTSFNWSPTAVGIVAEESRDPFRILISCLISLRTKDEVTDAASQRLFALADTPAQMPIARPRSSRGKTSVTIDREEVIMSAPLMPIG